VAPAAGPDVAGALAVAALLAMVMLPELLGMRAERQEALFHRVGLSHYQRDRIEVFLRPDSDPLGAGWNRRQSEIAIGSGGVWGRGYMQGRQNLLGFLPRTVSPTDFIFAVIAEETGFAGAAALLGLYVVLLGCGLLAALQAPDLMGRVLCVGITTLIFSHVFINVAMTVGLFAGDGHPPAAGELWRHLSGVHPLHAGAGAKRVRKKGWLIMFKKAIEGLLGFRFGRKVSKREIVVNSENLETRVAVMESGRLEEYQVEHPTEERIVGSIYKGRVRNLEDGLQAAFVDIGLKKNAFLHYWDMIRKTGRRSKPWRKAPGMAADRDRACAANGCRAGNHQTLSGRLGNRRAGHQGADRHQGAARDGQSEYSGPLPVMMPGSSCAACRARSRTTKRRLRLKKIVARLPQMPGVGLIVRTAGEGANQRAFVRDMRALTESWRQIQTNLRDLQAPACLYQEPDLVERVIRDWVTEDVDRIVIDNPKPSKWHASWVQDFAAAALPRAAVRGQPADFRAFHDRTPVG